MYFGSFRSDLVEGSRLTNSRPGPKISFFILTHLGVFEIFESVLGNFMFVKPRVAKFLGSFCRDVSSSSFPLKGW